MTSDEEVEKAVLGTIYESSGSLFSSHINRPGVIDEVNNQFDDVDENEVEYQLTVLEEDWLVERDGSTVQMGWQGLERYRELGGEVNLDEGLQQEILEVLLEAKKADPNHPYIEKEGLIDEIGESDETVTENVWILREVGYVETRGAMGTDYHGVAITAEGRRALDR